MHDSGSDIAPQHVAAQQEPTRTGWLQRCADHVPRAARIYHRRKRRHGDDGDQDDESGDGASVAQKCVHQPVAPMRGSIRVYTTSVSRLNAITMIEVMMNTPSSRV